MAVNPSATRHNTVVATSHGSRCGFPGAGEDDGAWSEALSSPSSAKARSVAVWKRAAGAFSRHRSTMRTRVAGIWRSLAGSLGRSSARIALTASAAVFPGNARRPDSISNNNTPTAKMSERWSIVWPRTCSGDMYPTVPRTTPGSVAVNRLNSPVPSGDSVSFASPKSRIFARSSVVTKMFAGFKSRWRIPFS